MKTHAALTAIVLFAVSAGAAAADTAGYVKRNGKKTRVTAVYAHQEANTIVIVFDDRASATKAIEKKSRGGYAVTGEGVSAATVFYDLASKGGHPIELAIMDGDPRTVSELAVLTARNASATQLSPSAARVEIVREDDQRIEGKATYADGKTTMSLPFAIDKNRVGHAKTQASDMPPPPPAPPPPSNPRAMLMMAADLLELQINDYYQQHGNTWPASVDQVDKQRHEPNDPVASRRLGPDGVLTIVFVPDAPFVGGKTVVFTPSVNADGIEWHCAMQGLPDACE